MERETKEPSIDVRQLVTASNLVRNFGAWQERALQEPVYIMHHGRPRLMLTSVEAARSVAERSHGNNEASELEAVLDAIDDLIVIADDEDVIRDMSREARLFFRLSRSDGLSIYSLFPATTTPLIRAALDRVRTSGIKEILDVRAGQDFDRRLELVIRRLDGGTAILVRDRTREESLMVAPAAVQAFNQATELLGNVAAITVNQRGYITTATISSEALTGLTREALLSTRFVSLLDIASRVSVGEALDAVLGMGSVRQIDATLLVNRGEPRLVRLAITPLLEYALVLIKAPSGASPSDKPA